MNPAKILVVSDFYPSLRKPAEGSFIHRRAKQLDAAGLEIDIFTTKVLTFATYLRFPRDVLDYYRTPKRFQYYWDNLCVHGFCVHLAFPGYVRSRTQPWLLHRAISPELDYLFERRPFDIIQLANGGPLSQAISRYAMRKNIPYVSSAIGGHIDSCFDKPNSFSYKRECSILLNSKFVVCVSEDMKRKVMQMTDSQAKAITFYSGVDTQEIKPNPDLREKFRDKLSFSANDTVILFIGHIIQEKGVYELLNVFAQLLNVAANLRLLMVGSIVENVRIKSVIAKLGITSHVTLTGGVPHEDIHGYLNASDVFVFPSWMEGMPNAVMEACSCGLPVVSTNVGGISELIIHGETGILVAPRDEAALYNEVVNLIKSPQKAVQLATAARKRMIKDFNYQKNGQQLVSLISDVFYNTKK